MHPTIGEWLRPPPEQPFEPADGDAWLTEDMGHWERFGFGPWAVIERASGDYLGRIGLKWTDVGDRAGIEVLWAVDPGATARGSRPRPPRRRWSWRPSWSWTRSSR